LRKENQTTRGCAIQKKLVRKGKKESQEKNRKRVCVGARRRMDRTYKREPLGVGEEQPCKKCNPKKKTLGAKPIRKVLKGVTVLF